MLDDKSALELGSVCRRLFRRLPPSLCLALGWASWGNLSGGGGEEAAVDWAGTGGPVMLRCSARMGMRWNMHDC